MLPVVPFTAIASVRCQMSGGLYLVCACIHFDLRRGRRMHRYGRLMVRAPGQVAWRHHRVNVRRFAFMSLLRGRFYQNCEARPCCRYGEPNLTDASRAFIPIMAAADGRRWSVLTDCPSYPASPRRGPDGASTLPVLCSSSAPGPTSMWPRDLSTPTDGCHGRAACPGPRGCVRAGFRLCAPSRS